MKIIKTLIDPIKSNWILVSVITAIAIMCFLLWKLAAGSLQEFGLNAFTETLGLLVTVILIGYLIKKQEETRLLPQQASAYEDVRLLVSRIISFWADAYKNSVPGPPPSSLSVLFSKESFEKIGLNLDLDSQPNVIPKREWWQWLPENLKDFIQLAEKILERHNNILDPEAYFAVHKIASEGMKPEMITSIRNIDKMSGFPRPRILSCYWYMPEEHLDAILYLTRWCANKVELLESRGIQNLKKVVSEIQPWESVASPPCMIDPMALEKQYKEFDDFQKSNKKLNL